LICTLLLLISSYYFIADAYTSASLFYLILYYFELRCDKINGRITVLNLFHSKGVLILTKILIIDHNNICDEISVYNRFWKKHYFWFLYSVIPINLCVLHQVLFEEMMIYSLLMWFFIVVSSWIFIFFISFCASVVSNRIHSTAKKLYKLQLNLNQNNFLCARTKIKLMSCFERVSGTKTIGFSIRSLFVMSYPMLYRVSYFLIFSMHNLRLVLLFSFFS